MKEGFKGGGSLGGLTQRGQVRIRLGAGECECAFTGGIPCFTQQLRIQH